MEKIKYKIENDLCKTPCPHNMGLKDHLIPMVGSLYCKEGCKHCKDNKRWGNMGEVLCSYEDDIDDGSF